MAYAPVMGTLGVLGSPSNAALISPPVVTFVNAGQEPLLNDGEAAFLGWVKGRLADAG